MGKLGSHELDYSSDVDLLLLFDPAVLPRRERDDAGEAVRIARQIIEILQKRTEDGYVQRVDLRLRPSPEVTPIALPVNAAISHYESSALHGERRLSWRVRRRAISPSGDGSSNELIEPFVWRRSLDFGVIEEVRQISAPIRDHFSQGATMGPGFDLKRSGGIREVEFFVEIQQMIHGGRDASSGPAPRSTPSTRFSPPGVDKSMAAELAQAYRLLRTVGSPGGVQMVDDAPTHLLPASEAALNEDGAQLHGLADGGELLAALQPHVDRVGRIFDDLTDGQRPFQ